MTAIVETLVPRRLALGAHPPHDAARIVPPEAATLAETGLGRGVLHELTLKSLVSSGAATPAELSERLCLPLGPIEEVIARLRTEAMLRVARTAGPGEHLFMYELTDAGHAEALRAMARNGYVGPAPVSVETYTLVQSRQPVRSVDVTREAIASALTALVLPQALIDSIGAAMVSTKSLLLSGAPGNGKTTIAAAMRRMLTGTVYVPHAIDVDGQTITVFDERIHERAGALPRGLDRRFVPCRPPMIMLGGELTLADLDLKYSGSRHYYDAPPTVKANGGILVVDDLGRQRISPQELLNRWVRALDTGVDSLHLQTGQSFPAPFDSLLVLSTNIAIAELGDEAFLRRIRHKLVVPNPTRDEYLEILERSCAQADLRYDASAASALLARFYDVAGREPRGCHPGDIIALLLDYATFHGAPPECSRDTLFAAAEAYFAVSS